jgi:hypothetical protein
MPANYSLRRTALSVDPNDYLFRCDGIDVGRCYLRTLAGNEHWHWTIFIGLYVARPVESVPLAGAAETLEQAKAEFCESFDRMIAAGAVRLPHGI